MTNSNKTIVYFHTGRGGRFNNSGFKTFCGLKNIVEVLQIADTSGQWSFINPKNHNKIYSSLTNKNCTNLISLYEKCQDSNDFSEFEKKTGLEVGENYYNDHNGNLLISVKEAEIGVGSISWDGDFDTDNCIYLANCDESELMLILNSNEWGKEDLIKEFFDGKDLKIDWSKFDGNYSALIYEYFNFEVNIEDFYTTEI